MLMKNIFRQITAGVALAASLGFVSTSASAFEEFTVDPGDYSFITDTYTADRINGGYVEVITISFTDATSGTFSVSLQFQAGQFWNDLTAVQPIDTGLGFYYGLYAVYTGVGTFSLSGGGADFNVTSGSGDIDMYIDADVDTTFGAPATGAGDWVLGNTSDDVHIANGTILSGNGSSSGCVSGGINCGSFGTNTDFFLTADGSDYFVLPENFYDLSFQSGQFANFDITGEPVQTFTVVGSMDVVFEKVPEPATLAIFATGLLGLGFGARRRKH